MTIAFSVTTSENESENFLRETVHCLSKCHLEHTFIFISDKDFTSLIFPKNVIPVVIPEDVKSPLKRFIWYNFTIRKVLKKYTADVFITDMFCSPLIHVPRILISPAHGFIHHRSSNRQKQGFINKTFTGLFLKKAKAIISFSQFEKAGIIKEFKTDPVKIQVIYEGISENFEPVDLEERETLKEKYTDGNEFFMYAGTISPEKNLKNLLKAFSAFKKRQRSSMQLIIAGNEGKHFDQFKESLHLYKFKSEIKLLNDLSRQEMAKLTASCYSMALPSCNEISAHEILKAMKCGVPVITSSTGAMHEIADSAALYFNPEDHKELAEKMMLIFKDENLRKELIEKGNAQVKNYDWRKSAAALWELIEKTTGGVS